MTRNLDAYAATGTNILKHHKQMELTTSEICKVIDQLGAIDHGYIAYNALMYGYRAGVTAGRNIERADKKQNIQYIHC